MRPMEPLDRYAPPKTRPRRRARAEDVELRREHAVTERRLRSLGFFYLARGVAALLLVAFELRQSGVDALVLIAAADALVVAWTGLRLDTLRPDALVWVAAAAIVEVTLAMVSGPGISAVPTIVVQGLVVFYVTRPGPRAVLDPAYRGVVERTADTRAPIAWWGYTLGVMSVVATAALLFVSQRK